MTKNQRLKQAICLLDQQCWCWGKDIERQQGNWLLEVGFQRTQPPSQYENCSSIYRMDLDEGREIILRGYGLFFCIKEQGAIFLPRFKFTPLYSTNPLLNCQLWQAFELPGLCSLNDDNRLICTQLTCEAIDWISQYELDIVAKLGVDYRQDSLKEWKGKSGRIPAVEMASSWKQLKNHLDEIFDE